MKLKQLFERSLAAVSGRDIQRFQKNQREDDVDSKDIDIEKTEEVKRKIGKFIRGGKIMLYRGVDSVIDPIERLKKKQTIGRSWTYDLKSAKAYRGTGHGNEYILQTTIPEKYIDWDATIALNTIDVRGNFEREIRLFKGTPIKLDRIYSEEGTALRQMDTSELDNINFKIR